MTAAPPASPPDGLRIRSAWSVSWHGVWTVAAVDLRQRVRSTRWRIALLAWFIAVGAIALLAAGALNSVLGGFEPADRGPMGPAVFGVVVFFVLFLGMMVAPALSSSAINGERVAGTLATLQTTLLTAAEIVLGKLLAAWLAAITFLIAGLPFIIWSLTLGGVPVASLITTLVLVSVELAVVCAIGIGFSALVTKPSGSAVLTFLVVGGLTVVSLILFAFTAPLVVAQEDTRVWTVPADYEWTETGPAPVCQWETQKVEKVHTERTWWLLAVNPFVIVADAAPPSGKLDTTADAGDPLAAIRLGVRTARTGPTDEENWCGGFGEKSPVKEVPLDKQPAWPWGLAVNALIGGIGVTTAIRRLRIPQGTLARGTRVA